jgi:hypothetical protein
MPSDLVGDVPDEQRKEVEIGMALARVARSHVDHLGLPAVGVHEGELAEAHAVDRVGDLREQRTQRGAGHRHGSGEADVFVGLPVAQRREAQAGYLRG